MAIDLKNPLTQRYLMAGLILVGLLYAWYAFIYSPKADDITAKQQTLEGLETQLQQARLKAASLPKLKEEAVKLWREFKTMEPLLPNRHDVAAFLSESQRAAYSSGVQITSVLPLKAEPVEFYVKNPYRIVISGTYHNFGSFLAKVANFPFVTSTSELIMVGQRRSKTNPVTVIVTLTIASYNVKNEEVIEEPNFDNLQNLKIPGAAAADAKGVKPGEPGAAPGGAPGAAPPGAPGAAPKKGGGE